MPRRTTKSGLSFPYRVGRLLCQANCSTACVWLAMLMLSINSSADETTKATIDRDRLLAAHRQDAADYILFRDATKTHQLALKPDPVYRWSNPTRSGGQVGDVFVWTDEGRAGAIATIFSHPEDGRRVMCHELHSLSASVIVPERTGTNLWHPKAGLTTKAVPNALEPANTPAKRLIQLGNLARDFSAESRDEKGERWELRLLPKHLYRYEATTGEVFDGAVFAFVTSAGTDPEIIIKLEATRLEEGQPAEWRFAAARFSDLNLYLRYQDKQIWSSIRTADNAFDRNREQTFRFYRDRVIDELLAVSSSDIPKTKEE